MADELDIGVEPEGTIRLLESWVVWHDADSVGDRQSTVTSVVNGEIAVGEDGALWVTLGGKTTGLFSAGTWRRVSRLMLRELSGGLVEPVPMMKDEELKN